MLTFSDGRVVSDENPRRFGNGERLSKTCRGEKGQRFENYENIET
jgi:hypothetical protein